MGSFSIMHWLIVLVIVLLIFGTKKLRNIGQDLGGAVKGFKEGMREEPDASKNPVQLDNQQQDQNTIEAQVREKNNN